VVLLQPQVVLEPSSVFRLTITVNMANTKYEVKKFNGKNNFYLWRRSMKDLLIQQGVYKVTLEEANIPQ
jgi:hypothetical protein